MENKLRIIFREIFVAYSFLLLGSLGAIIWNIGGLIAKSILPSLTGNNIAFEHTAFYLAIFSYIVSIKIRYDLKNE